MVYDMCYVFELLYRIIMPFCFRARFIREQLQPRTSTIESETNSGPKLRQHSMILTVQLQGYVNSKCFLLAVPWSRIVNHDTICQFIYLLFNSSVFYDLFRPCFIKQLETMRRFDNKLTTKHLENKHSFGQSFLMKPLCKHFRFWFCEHERESVFRKSFLLLDGFSVCQ